MSRQKRLLIWLAGIIALLGLSYASLPWVLTGLIKHSLAARGLSDIQLRIDYPGWHKIRLHRLAFTMEGQQHIDCSVAEVEIGYQLSDLLTGSLTRVRVPLVTLRLQSIPGLAPSAPSATALPLAALLSGQWLADIPVHELLLEQLKLDAQLAADAVSTLQLSAQLREAQLQVNGDMRLPSLPQPLAFSLNASHTGAARLLLSSADQAAAPMLALMVKPRAADPAASLDNAITLNGELTARLDKLWSMLMPLLPGEVQAAGIEGDLNSHWQAQVDALPGAAHWQVSGETTVQGLGGRWHEQLLPRGELSANFSADPQQLTLQSTWRAAAQAVVLEAKGRYQFGNGHAHADLTLAPVVFSDSGFVLSRLLKSWPYPFDITAGRVSGSARLDWQQAFDLQGAVQLDKLGGHYNQVTFTGLSGEVALALPNSRGEGWHTRQDAQLHVDVVDVGFPVANIKAAFALPAAPGTQLPVVQVKTFSAELLGGRARSGPFELDFGRANNAFVVQLEQIDLHEIMQLEQQEGLQGSGRLDGQLPIEIAGTAIVVPHGQLSAVAPGGNIRYTPTPKVATMAQSNASLKMVVNALSDFQYHLLDVIADYQAGGNLALQVRLQGKNPAWQRGQPIHLNLNLEENIPALLRSLQLSSEISEQLQKRYQTPR